MTDRGECAPRGESAPERQTMVRGLRIACRNISVSLKDAGPRVAGSAEKDALRRSSTPGDGVLGTCDCVGGLNRARSSAGLQAEIFSSAEYRSDLTSWREQGEVFPGQGCGGKRGDLGDIVGRRHLDDVHAAEIEPGETAQDRLRLPGDEPADLRRAGARREGRVERVDIEAQIGRPVADDLADALGDGLRPCSCTSSANRIVTPLPTVQSCTSASIGERMPTCTVRRGSISPSSIAW